VQGQPPKKKTGRIILLSIVGAFVVMCGGCGVLASLGPSGSDTVSGGASTAATGSAGKGAVPAVAAIGQPVRDGKFEFVVKSLRCGVGQVGNDEFSRQKAQGQFCLATVTVKNIGDEAQTLDDSNQKAFVGQKSYDVDSLAGMTANQGANGDSTSVWLNNINPGNAVSGVLVWDVPAGAKLDKIVLHDSLFSGGVEVKVA
jgi:hypothetical protein